MVQLVKSLLILGFSPVAPFLFGATDTIVHIGRLEVTLPAPDGFAPVVPEMKTVNQLLDATTFKDNERLAHFIPETDVKAAMANDLPEMARSFSVQTPKKTLERTVTKSDFAQLTSNLLKQNSDIIKKIEKDIPNLVKETDAKLKAADLDLELQNLSLVPLPAHQQDERVLAYSMFLTIQNSGGPIQIACTANILHIKARLLYVYAYASPMELSWTRDVSKRWVAAILAANPTPPGLAKLEEHGPSLFRMPENTILRNALIGALVGGVGGLIRAMVRRKKSPTA